MDLKFTFAKPQHTHDTPQNSALPLLNSPNSSELIIRVSVKEAQLVATASGADGNEYARQSVPLGKDLMSTGMDNIPASAYRSAIARVIAELDTKLAGSVTRLEVPAAAASVLMQAEFIDAAASTTQTLQLRAGINTGTPVQVY